MREPSQTSRAIVLAQPNHNIRAVGWAGGSTAPGPSPRCCRGARRKQRWNAEAEILKWSHAHLVC